MPLSETRGCDEKDIGQGTAAVLSETPGTVFFNNAVSVKTLILGHFLSLRKISAGNILGGEGSHQLTKQDPVGRDKL